MLRGGGGVLCVGGVEGLIKWNCPAAHPALCRVHSIPPHPLHPLCDIVIPPPGVDGALARALTHPAVSPPPPSVAGWQWKENKMALVHTIFAPFLNQIFMKLNGIFPESDSSIVFFLPVLKYL